MAHQQQRYHCPGTSPALGWHLWMFTIKQCERDKIIIKFFAQQRRMLWAVARPQFVVVVDNGRNRQSSSFVRTPWCHNAVPPLLLCCSCIMFVWLRWIGSSSSRPSSSSSLRPNEQQQSVPRIGLRRLNLIPPIVEFENWIIVLAVMR